MGIFDTLALFSSQGKLGKGVQSPLYFDFCIALLGIAPRFSRDVPLVTTTRLCLHEEAEPHNMGFYLFIWDFGYPLPYFPLRENWARVSKVPLYPELQQGFDFCSNYSF